VSAPLTQSTTRPASASGGGADGPQRAAVAAAGASLPLAEPTVAAAALVQTQLRETRKKLEDEVKRRAELESRARALVDARRGVTHAATAAAARLVGAAHRAERRHAREARRRCRVAPVDERPDPECDGAPRRAAPRVDAAPSYGDAVSPATAPSPIKPTQASPPSAPTPSPLEHEARCHSGAAATATTPLRRGATTTPYVATRSARRAWRTETMRGCFHEVLLLVVGVLTLLGPSVYLYARDGSFVRDAPLAPPAAVVTAQLAALEAAAQSANTARAGLFAEDWCWVG
jgi:hypothetical protein